MLGAQSASVEHASALTTGAQSLQPQRPAVAASSTLILQQAWLLGALGYAVAFLMGEFAFPLFPRRVLITPAISQMAPIATLVVVTLSSLLGLVRVMKIDPAKALEG